MSYPYPINQPIPNINLPRAIEYPMAGTHRSAFSPYKQTQGTVDKAIMQGAQALNVMKSLEVQPCTYPQQIQGVVNEVVVHTTQTLNPPAE